MLSPLSNCIDFIAEHFKFNFRLQLHCLLFRLNASLPVNIHRCVCVLLLLRSTESFTLENLFPAKNKKFPPPSNIQIYISIKFCGKTFPFSKSFPCYKRYNYNRFSLSGCRRRTHKI